MYGPLPVIRNCITSCNCPGFSAVLTVLHWFAAGTLLRLNVPSPEHTEYGKPDWRRKIPAICQPDRLGRRAKVQHNAASQIDFPDPPRAGGALGLRGASFSKRCRGVLRASAVRLIYVSASLQYSTHLAISAITVDPSGTLYSNSIVP